MEWLDVVTNYVSWLDDRKPGNYPENTPILTFKRHLKVCVPAHRGRTWDELGPEGNLPGNSTGF
jgi:hypothetical protein